MRLFNLKIGLMLALWILSLLAVYLYAQRHSLLLVDKSSTVVLENDRVRVKDVTFDPGVIPPMHTHALDHVGVVIEGGTLQFNYPDGKVETLELKTGGVGWRNKGTTHQAVNLGKKPVRVVEVELK